MGKKGGDDVTTGYRYAFSILSGICRGPVDQLFLIKADGKIFYDLPITFTTEAVVDAQQLFGGDKGQGGIYGVLSVFFGRLDQVIPADSQLRRIMTGLRVSQLRGVVTSFFNGQICSNDPYPKAWQYRVRRALKGWHNDDCWYPEKALIQLSDPSIATYAVGPSEGNTATSTTLVDAFGNPTSDPTAAISTVTTTYQQQTVSTYTPGTGTSTTYNVPQFYNDIHAMNPAHIIYECATNPDWGRGLPPELIDNTSFASAANTLYNEGFGLCLKWSQQEDIDAFVQVVIDHIGAAVYTNPITGLLSIRLIRSDYNIADLPTFDYEHGLLEVTSVQTAASDAIANEVIIKYHSPVTDTDREARAQNIASINSLASFMTVTKDYSGLPTSTLALKAAARELKVNSSGWKRVEFKIDRRGYYLVPGDVLSLIAPDRGLQMIVRVATIDQSQMKDGYITVVGSQDIFGWPLHALQEPQMGTFQEVNRYPQPVQVQNLSVATYRDTIKFGSSVPQGAGVADEQAGGVLLPIIDGVEGWGIGQTFVTVQAKRPSSVAVAYAVYVKRSSVVSSIYPGHRAFDEDLVHDWQITNYLNFQNVSTLNSAIGVGDTTFQIGGDINPSNARIGGCYMMCDASFAFSVAGNEEFVRLDAISQNPTTGIVTVTVARGCVDTPAIAHVRGSRFWAYDESGGAVGEAFGWYDNVGVKCLTHTVSRGDLDPSAAVSMSVLPDARAYQPYPGAGFKVNGFVRDQVPPQSGDLVCTYHHRNRVTQAEHLFGEDEANIAPELGTIYGIFVYATTGGPVTDGAALTKYEIPFVYTGGFPSAPGITDDTIHITAEDLIATGIVTGPMTLAFYTGRGTPTPGGEPTNFWSARVAVISEFQYIVDAVPPDTDTSGGFNFDFDNNFTGG
jgi:hypothetical protein